MAQTITGDSSHAAELMENTVAQVSRYLDPHCVVAFSREIDGLLMLSFHRALRRRLAKLRRIESLGGVKELSNRAIDRTWTRQVHARLELEEIVRLLSERSRMILALRYAGYIMEGVCTGARIFCGSGAQCFLAGLSIYGGVERKYRVGENSFLSDSRIQVAFLTGKTV